MNIFTKKNACICLTIIAYAANFAMEHVSLKPDTINLSQIGQFNVIPAKNFILTPSVFEQDTEETEDTSASFLLANMIWQNKEFQAELTPFPDKETYTQLVAQYIEKLKQAIDTIPQDIKCPKILFPAGVNTQWESDDICDIFLQNNDIERELLSTERLLQEYALFDN